LKNPYAILDRKEMGRVLIQTSTIIANCCYSFEMIRALPGSTLALPLSSGALPVVTGALPAYTGALPYLYCSSTGYIIPRIITLVVPGRAKDEAGKAIPSRIIPGILNILFHPGSKLPDVPGSSRTLPAELRMYSGCSRSHPRSFPDVYRGSAGM
jgi:hypothetical protein